MPPLCIEPSGNLAVRIPVNSCAAHLRGPDHFCSSVSSSGNIRHARRRRGERVSRRTGVTNKIVSFALPMGRANPVAQSLVAVAQMKMGGWALLRPAKRGAPPLSLRWLW
jgi:hypothetical protein